MFSEEIFALPFAVPPLTYIKVIRGRGLSCYGVANAVGCWPGQQKAEKSWQERKQACFVGIKILPGVQILWMRLVERREAKSVSSHSALSAQLQLCSNFWVILNQKSPILSLQAPWLGTWLLWILEFHSKQKHDFHCYSKNWSLWGIEHCWDLKKILSEWVMSSPVLLGSGTLFSCLC